MNSTPEENNRITETINRMEHIDMAHMWMFSRRNHPYLKEPFFEVFQKRLFDHFGGFTAEIKKELFR